ncbi:branched-chain amino acid transport system substrate-binding protein [Methylobacterium sp. 174MFSha1.1]|uniref:urea ABC transporter substrate-binding protein n=1 Tax=Methylobacterium sp. 174MFSha1.1 TaxID=1502749 RepID=UPI0008F390C8|nr:urea ABC transporter substrate-binding protein [Methylobacterium sp. 174MFSha1.1]SFU42949.1 branched-chain amino acid transport system substrate-binding protein [Methylobacterium sp. 174MFSha1.1]
MSLLRSLRTGTAALLLLAGPVQAADPIKVGLLEDISGDLAVIGLPKLHGAQLAVEEINKAGGVLGRPLELIHLDPQGDNARYQEFGRRLLNRDKVDVLFGGITSASREALRPVVNRTKVPYFYTNQYEGGVCDANMVSMGAVPEQQFSTLIPWMVEKFGKKVYVIAADYNFGQISAEWNRTLMKKLGGEVVGEEFIPLGVSQFAQTIQNIQKAKPDWLLTINVGAAQDSFFEQAAAAKLNLPMGSSIKIMLGFEHKRFAPPALNNMHATANWFEELDTPAANDFKARWKAKFPNETYINDMGYNAYAGLFMYRMLAERAKSLKLDDLRKVMAAGDACIEAPEGQVCIDPKSQHTSHHMRLVSVGPKHEVTVDKDYGTIQPYWLGEIGCDLTKKNDKEQYTPDNLPKK